MWYSINRGWNFDRSLKFALLDRARWNRGKQEEFRQRLEYTI